VFFLLLLTHFAVDNLEHVVRQDCLLCCHGDWCQMNLEGVCRRGGEEIFCPA
jgi:hypothetical protein